LWRQPHYHGPMEIERDELAIADEQLGQTEARLCRVIQNLTHEEQSKEDGLRLLDVTMRALARIREHRAVIRERMENQRAGAPARADEMRFEPMDAPEFDAAYDADE
jgi:hypothetical protein